MSRRSRQIEFAYELLRRRKQDFEKGDDSGMEYMQQFSERLKWLKEYPLTKNYRVKARNRRRYN